MRGRFCWGWFPLPRPASSGNPDRWAPAAPFCLACITLPCLSLCKIYCDRVCARARVARHWRGLSWQPEATSGCSEHCLLSGPGVGPRARWMARACPWGLVLSLLWPGKSQTFRKAEVCPFYLWPVLNWLRSQCAVKQTRVPLVWARALCPVLAPRCPPRWRAAPLPVCWSQVQSAFSQLDLVRCQPPKVLGQIPRERKHL